MTDQIRCLIKVKRILYPKYYSSGDWTIFLASIEELYEGEPYQTSEIKIKGKTYDLDFSGLYTFTGTLESHDVYGHSYQISTLAKECDFSNPVQQRIYLESLYTERQVKLLYAAFKNPYEVIRNQDIDALSQIKGIGKATAQRMVANFLKDLDKSRAYVALSEYDLSVEQIDSLIKRFKGNVERMISTIKNNPYTMIYEIDGIGWKKADQVAMSKGITFDDPRRIEAYIVYQLNSITEQGHTWVSPQWLITNTLSGLELSVDHLDRFRECLYSLHEKELLWWSEDKQQIALFRIRHIEERIAEELYRISKGTPLLPNSCSTQAELLKQIEMIQGWEFTEEQRNAIDNVMQHNVVIVTGSAGTGKSSVVAGVLKILQGYDFAQCALSGRAAARLTEVTGREGSTIHRLLGYTPGGFARNESFPLDQKIIILDEVSMVGAEIFLDLLKAIPTGAKLIMLGDPGQLESIGLCNIFKDMLESNVIPVSFLTKIHRQAAKSAIITESLKVRNQEQLIPQDWVGTEIRGELKDLKLAIYSDPILSHDTIIEQYQELIDSGIDYCDIQIVVPMKQRGEICTHRLNNAIQRLVNPQKYENDSIRIDPKNKGEAGYCLRVNDRVIVTKNMYQAVRYDPIDPPYKRITVLDEDGYEFETLDICPVYNGDRGIIKIARSDYIVVTFDQWGDITIPTGDFSKIELGYALSCHKLQGSEANYVIVGFDMGGRMLLTKEWLYTAITRAKKKCVVCAESRAMAFAVANSNISIKQTMLENLLRVQFFKRDDGQ